MSNENMIKCVLKWSIRGGVFVLLLSPIAVYILKFGWTITDSHIRWGEMGAAMSGIYTPILAILTLSVLIVQVRMQAQLNKHEFDQTLISQTRVDLAYYLAQLEAELSGRGYEGFKTTHEAISPFMYASLADLGTEPLQLISSTLNKASPRLASLWAAVYTQLSGLNVDELPYLQHYAMAKQMVSAVLTFKTCVALDNYLYTTVGQRVAYPYCFSMVVPTAED